MSSIATPDEMREYISNYLEIPEEDITIYEEPDDFTVNVRIENASEKEVREVKDALQGFGLAGVKYDVDSAPEEDESSGHRIEAEQVEMVVDGEEVGEVENFSLESDVSHPDIESLYPQVADPDEEYSGSMEVEVGEEMAESLAESFGEAIEGAMEGMAETFSEIASAMAPALSEAASSMEGMTEVMNQYMNKINALQKGDPLIAEMREGGTIEVELRKLLDDTAEEVYFHTEHEGRVSVAEYWEDDPEVSPDDRAVLVDLPNASENPYSFPSSKVEIAGLETIAGVGSNKADALREAGFGTYLDVRLASQQELSEVDGIGNALAARMKADVGEPEGDGQISVDGFSVQARDVQAHCSNPDCEEEISSESPDAVEGDQGELYCSLNCLHEVYG